MPRRKTATDKAAAPPPETPAEKPETPMYRAPRDMNDVYQYFRRVTNDPCFPYLVQLGEQMANLAEGGLPQKEDDVTKVFAAAMMRRGFRMLFEELTRRGKQAGQTTPFDELFANDKVVSHVRENVL